MQKRFQDRCVLVLILGSMLTSCTSTATNQANSSSSAVTLPVPLPISAVPNAAQVEYRVGPFDLLEISVFQVPDLSKTVKVNASGKIDMPLIGAISAGGKTVSELEADIASKLDRQYLQSAQVSVFVKEANSQQVTVDGAVVKSGLVSITGQTTLLQAIAMSGGLAVGADPDGILVFRTVGQQRMVAKFNLSVIRKGRGEDPLLYGGDVVVVDKSGLRSALAAVRESIPLFGLFSAVSM